MFLALLIMSSVYETSSSKFMYWKLNILFFFLLLALQFAGSVLSIESMTNVSRVFFVIGSLEKYAELHTELKWNGWVLMLIISLCLWRGALYLHSNPEILVGMLAL
eukprot:m.237652 g.237652  ORF g.237652 m.237652 type:complete len:106 (-) comp16057_c0_seq35:1580-1897(-)